MGGPSKRLKKKQLRRREVAANEAAYGPGYKRKMAQFPVVRYRDEAGFHEARMSIEDAEGLRLDELVAEHRDMTELYLPEGMTRLGAGVFGREKGACESLRLVHLPSTLTRLGRDCFAGCRSLESVKLPVGLTEVRPGCFDGCESLSRVEFQGDGVAKIGARAFRGCTGLKSVSLPGSVTEIDDFAFDGCEGLSKLDMEVGKLERVGYAAFRACGSLDASELYSMACARPGAFDFTKGRSREATYTTSDGSTGRADCLYLVGSTGYGDVEAATSVSLPDGMTYIPEGFLCGHGNLRELDVPSSVRYVEGGALCDCRHLTDVKLAGEAPEVPLSDKREAAVPVKSPEGWTRTYKLELYDSHGDRISDRTPWAAAFAGSPCEDAMRLKYASMVVNEPGPSSKHRSDAKSVLFDAQVRSGESRAMVLAAQRARCTGRLSGVPEAQGPSQGLDFDY